MSKAKKTTVSYVQLLIDLKNQLSLRYYKNQDQLKKELEKISKKFDIKNGEHMKLPL